MLLKKITFADKGPTQCITDRALTGIFLKLFYKEYEGKDEYFTRIDSIRGTTDFGFHINWTPNIDSKICELDEVKFVSEALITAKQHRVIDEGIYNIIKQSDIYTIGEHVVASDGEPIFKIIRGAANWAFKPMEFAYYNGRGVFRHMPDYDSSPYQIDMELSVQNQRKEKLPVKMFNHMQEYYKDKGLEVIESLEGLELVDKIG